MWSSTNLFFALFDCVLDLVLPRDAGGYNGSVWCQPRWKRKLAGSYMDLLRVGYSLALGKSVLGLVKYVVSYSALKPGKLR